MDTRTAVWVSTAEKNFKSFWEKLGIFLESLGRSQRQLCINPVCEIKDKKLEVYSQTLAEVAGGGGCCVDGAPVVRDRSNGGRWVSPVLSCNLPAIVVPPGGTTSVQVASPQIGI